MRVTEGDKDNAVMSESGQGSQGSGFLASILGTSRYEDTSVFSG